TYSLASRRRSTATRPSPTETEVVMRLPVASLVIAAMCLGACSSTPRAFVAEVKPVPPDRTVFDGMFFSCADEVAAGRKENFQTGQLDPGQASGAVAATAGAALIYGGASAGVWAGVGAVGAGATLVMLAPVAWVGVSAVVRSGREQAVQKAMGACLQQNGYTVT